MHIDKYEEAIMNCRFCFMCRHLSTIGQVRGTEVDTPRVRAAMLYGLRNGTNSFDDSDFVDALYRQDLSACCRRNCVNGYDENGLAIAARADVVEAGKAPEDVEKLAKKLMKTADWKTVGRGKVGLFVDNTTASDKDEVLALQKLLKKTSGEFVMISGGCIGKALKVLGYVNEGREAARKFAAFVNDLGLQTLVVPNPAAYDALKADYPEWGIAIDAKVVCTARYLLDAKVKFSVPAGEVYYLADDFMRNYQHCDCPEKLLKVLKAVEKPFGTNDEESYNCGEGAIVLDRLNPQLVKEMALYVAERADDPKKDRLVTLGVYAKNQLTKYGRLNVITLGELAAACL